MKDFFQQFLPPSEVWLTWLVQAVLAVGLLALVAGLLIAVLGRIPVIGPLLAGIVRLLVGNYEKWLSERVPKLADLSVLAVEERLASLAKLRPEIETTLLSPQSRASTKLKSAVDGLISLAPGLSAADAAQQVEAAVARMRAAGLEQKSEG
ncbi:MAG: hypothetical protein H5T84_02465 [Thermoleophilia bacterium]|nr:hypothetical protein [Thermoleophilia bacterium]